MGTASSILRKASEVDSDQTLPVHVAKHEILDTNKVMAGDNSPWGSYLPEVCLTAETTISARAREVRPQE